MGHIAEHIILGIPEEREQRYRSQIKAMTFLDRPLFTELARVNRDAALSALRILLDMPDLKYDKRPRPNRIFKLSVQDDDILYFSLRTQDQKIASLLDFVDKEKGEWRARAYSNILDVSIARQYGLSEVSSDEESASVPDSYVIFLMKNDLFHEGKPCYHFERCYSKVNKEGVVSADGGSHIIYINGAYTGNDDFGLLMHDFRCSDPEEIKTGFLRNAAIQIKNSDDSLFVLPQIMEREYLKTNGLDQKIRVYRINPICPYCGEEHVYYDVTLTEKEQKQIDAAYENPDLKGKSDLEQLIRTMNNAPVYIIRRVHCICGKSYDVKIGVTRQDEI